ncbi:MAG: methyltransferase domain-containing protein [Acidobacteria bacterium]|nr:methyltransferase domain-containing protein [Acidobacteriota bacterium]
MNTEFTGERVVPRQVSVDLWNEHFSRYCYAARMAQGKRVLDLGCGTGYGTAELAKTAASATGVDVAEDAVAYASQHYPGIQFVRASATSTGLADASFDLITAFEVIEHLTDWRALLAEAKRLLAPGGTFLVSTPNREYYAESRGASGPNPFHEHEFEYTEFRDAVSEFFAPVEILLQNRTEAFAFVSAGFAGDATAVVQGSGNVSDTAFFLAVCGISATPAFVYVPAAANLMRERERHIAKLDDEVRTKDSWLAETRAERDQAMALHRDMEHEVERRNAWARQLEAELEEARGHLSRTQAEFEASRAESQSIADAYEAKVRELESDVAERSTWAQETEARLQAELTAKANELAEAVRLLDAAETAVVERTQWAQSLRRELDLVRESRWVKLGRKFGLGPRIGG